MFFRKEARGGIEAKAFINRSFEEWIYGDKLDIGITGTTKRSSAFPIAIFNSSSLCFTFHTLFWVGNLNPLWLTGSPFSMEHVCPHIHFFLRFWGISDSEWVLLKWLDESGSKFWIHNKCKKVKSHFMNRFKVWKATIFLRFFLNICLKGQKCSSDMFIKNCNKKLSQKNVIKIVIKNCHKKLS